MAPRIVLIDTTPPDYVFSKCTYYPLHPSEVKLASLEDAQLVLVDYKIEDWREELSHNDIPEILRPIDGLALAHSIRRGLQHDPQPPAVALITSEYALAASPLPATTQPFQLARLNGIEWVYSKASSISAIESLAEACSENLYALVGANEDVRLQYLLRYLGKPTPDDFDFFGDDVANAYPPLHQLHDWNHGLLVLRWLLHRVLPFPTFLVADTYIACRAQCNLEQLRTFLNEKIDFLEEALYMGACHEMFPRRFWRSGIEKIFHLALGAEQFDPTAVRNYLSATFKKEIEPLTTTYIETLASDYVYGSIIAEQSKTKTGIVDDWPAFANNPRVFK